MKESSILHEGRLFWVAKVKGGAEVRRNRGTHAEAVLRFTGAEAGRRAVGSVKAFEQQLDDGTASDALKKVFGVE